jgi:hypothetical protein
MQIRKLTCALLILAVLGSATSARAKVVEDVSGTLQTLTSIGDALDSPDHHPVHILYLHGIDVQGSGGSAMLRESVCTKLKLCAVSDWKNAGVEFPDKGEFSSDVQPPTLAYLGSPVWKSEEEWQAAAPFVIHWVVHLRGHSSVLVVDEINWWPLLLSLKCRRVIVPEASLAGPDRQLIQLCSESSLQNPDGSGRFYPWITADQASKLEQIRPRGALLNRAMKGGLVDWGLGDVMLAVGQMNGILRDGVRQLMAKSAAFDPNKGALLAAGAAGASDARGQYDWKSQLVHDNKMDQEFIGVTHSLGSYLFFNTLNQESFGATGQKLSAQDAARLAAEERAVQYIFERTSQVYFFANQIQMLEITNLEDAPSPATNAFVSRGLAPPPQTSLNPAANFRSLVNRWKEIQANFQSNLHPNDEAAREKIQVVAWSDPSDVMTFRVPKIGNVDVVNLYSQNASRWFGLLESPGAAHRNYAKNLDVLHVMFDDTAHRPAGN